MVLSRLGSGENLNDIEVDHMSAMRGAEYRSLGKW